MKDEMPGSDEPRRTGCAILFVPTLIVVDTVGMLQSWAAPYYKLVSVVGLTGLVCGAVLGGFAFAKTKLWTPYSLSFWLVLGGLVGLSVSTGSVLLIISYFLR